jgi:hypothetical protein
MFNWFVIVAWRNPGWLIRDRAIYKELRSKIWGKKRKQQKKKPH